MTDGALVQAPGPAWAPAAILVVDDEANKRLAIRSMLEPLGHAIVDADCGREALHAVMRQSFAVILMDVHMPLMDGYEAARRIRRLRHLSRTPIIFITAFGAGESETANAYASGAVDFIFTPVVPVVLQAKVSAFVELFVQSQELQRSLKSITDLNTALRNSEVRSRAVLHNVADAIVTAGESGLIESLNRSARRLFDYREEEVIGQPLQLIIAPSRHDEFLNARTPQSRRRAKDLPPTSTETVGVRRGGACFAMEMDLSEVQIGERAITIACIRDVSDKKDYTESLEHQMLHDDLTGLPNRTLFSDRLQRAIASVESAGEPLGVLLVDLDEFGVPTTISQASVTARSFRRSPNGCAARCAARTPSRAWVAARSGSFPPARPTWK